MKAIVLDIEGTTTDIKFVTQTLFPYARERMGEFLAANADAPVIADAISRVRTEMGEPNATNQDVATELVAWIDQDKKKEPLKTIQGHIWRAGYEDGSIEAHIYPDVEPAMSRWKAQGLTIAIFSSGSIPAQKLLFAHTNSGDLTPHLSAYFDLSTGSKREVASYMAIADALHLSPQEIRFYSDAPAEIAAASAAGMEAVLVERDGPVDAPGMPRRVTSFTDENP